ncbi:hypothetical protein K457DRAFT_605332 [Linnemannia elongata AG-77]|uniref:Uncharacterized protein n=1 Tax=Linnemannia elongata AG-77 TaxID=1314771 RepID=A0A197JR27_9FUNG|nr:hypothetical protein K457DRAFT_605332 [Linnemannia elongata AG-77]
MAEEPQLQSFRRGSTDRILQVEALYHPELRQHIVFWDDILEVFPSAISVVNGRIVISRARDDSFRFIEPRCIRHQPGKVLQVVFAEDLNLSYPTSSKPSTSTKATSVTAVTTERVVQSQNLTLQNIEQCHGREHNARHELRTFYLLPVHRYYRSSFQTPLCPHRSRRRKFVGRERGRSSSPQHGQRSARHRPIRLAQSRLQKHSFDTQP